MSSKANILKEVKRLRKKHGFTQTQVAERLDPPLTQGAYRNIEAGVTEMKVSTLLQLADLFGVDVSELTGGKPEAHTIDMNDADALRAAMDEMNRKLDDMRDEQRDFFESVWQRMTGKGNSGQLGQGDPEEDADS